MAKINAPNKQYNGISASVVFTKGVGESDNPILLDWFKTHGYEVEEIDHDPPKEPEKFDGWDIDQLKGYAEEHSIDIGQASSVNGIIKKITEAEKEA
jgi:hypothetical protein